jgi:hypothetical protein
MQDVKFNIICILSVIFVPLSQRLRSIFCKEYGTHKSLLNSCVPPFHLRDYNNAEVCYKNEILTYEKLMLHLLSKNFQSLLWTMLQLIENTENKIHAKK